MKHIEIMEKRIELMGLSELTNWKYAAGGQIALWYITEYPNKISYYSADRKRFPMNNFIGALKYHTCFPNICDMKLNSRWVRI